ncbi:MAG: hypothetical protein IT176_14760 [Acidobacteria bacterium]|nr:hypothetical protein [Acidobacteriota bacterium]
MIDRHTSRAIDVTRGVSALGVIWGHAIFGFSIPLDLPLSGGSLCALAAAMAVLVTRVPAPGFHSRCEDVLAWAGVHTYGIYVYHSVLATANAALLKLPPGVPLLLLLSGSLAVAPISHGLIEEPLLRLKWRRAGVRPEAPVSRAVSAVS